MHPPYRITEHTADLGLEFRGKNPGALFERAGAALMDCLTDRRSLSVREYREFSAEGGDLEEVLVNFLRELLYLVNGRGFLIQRIVIDQLDERRVSGRAGGEPFDARRHVFTKEIKAVTYHGARITEDAAGLRGQVILDV